MTVLRVWYLFNGCVTSVSVSIAMDVRAIHHLGTVSFEGWIHTGSIAIYLH